MKYTVVIEQAVSDDVQPRLQELLAARFSLSPDQARKLASRKGGRLMKPTGRERAIVLLSIFQEVGARARLEQVADNDDGVPTAAATSTKPPAVLPLERSPDLHATEFGQIIGRGAAADASVATLTAQSTAARASSQPLSVNAAPSNLAAAAGLPPANDDFWAELAAPAVKSLSSEPQNINTNNEVDVFGIPLAAGAASKPSSESLGDGLFVPEPLLKNLAKSPSPVAGAPEKAADGALPDSPPADSWSDFTGALTIADTPAAAPKAVAEASPALLLNPEQDAPIALRRQPLLRRLTVASVTPLAVYTGLTLVTLGLVLNSSQRSLISNSAASIAAAVGAVLNTTDQNTVNQQLGTLLNRESVGFVQVELPDGTTFFRSQAPALDAVFGEKVSKWVDTNPVSGVFVQNETPANLYQEQLDQLVSVGAQESEPANVLKKAIADPVNQSIPNRNYQVERIGVYGNADGTRETRPAAVKSDKTLLYRIAVGVPIDAPNRQLRDTLLAVLIAGIAAMLFGAALAARAARRIIGPIERLVTAADAISLGDLTRKVQPESNDEVGDLAQALERMRLSLDSAMDRLRKRRKG